MIILSHDDRRNEFILRATHNEIAQLLGYTNWYSLSGTGRNPSADDTLDVAEIAACARLIRTEKERLERLRAEYGMRLEEINRLLAFADRRWPEPDQETDG